MQLNQQRSVQDRASLATKIHHRVEIPQHLSVPIQRGNRKANYILYGVVMNEGNSTETGHYTVYSKASDQWNQYWHHYNDYSISQVSKDITKIIIEDSNENKQAFQVH